MGYNSQPRIIDAKYLLDTIGENRIFEKYLGFSIDYDAYFANTALRMDNNGTCRFYWNGYKTKFADKAWGFDEDCFGVVMKKYHCNFGTAINIIANDFGIKSHTPPIVDDRLVKVIKGSYKEGETVIDIKERGFWTKRDVDYWSQYYIDSRILELYNVVSVAGASITTSKGTTNLAFTHTDLCFAYAERNNEKLFYKLYQPDKDTRNGKWLSNIPKRLYHGYKQLPEFTDTIVVTKALKDVMVLHRLEIAAVALQAESGTLSYNGYQLLKNRSKNLYTLFDWDIAGVKCAKRHKKLYGIEPLFITTGEKDISGFIKENKLKQTKQLITFTRGALGI